MKKELLLFLLVFILVLPLISSQEIPNYYNKYVNDFGNMFDQNQTLALQTLLYGLEQNTTAEVSVVTINECGLDYNGYATNLASTWKIGKADKDNGLLILYCLDVKKIVVQTGYGLEGILPDALVGRILDDYYVPLRDSNNTTQGIISATEQYAQVIQDNAAEVISGQSGGSSSSGSNTLAAIVIILLVISIFFFVVSRFQKKATKGNKKNKYGVYLNFLSIFLLFVYVVSGMFFILIIAIVLMVLLRIIGRNPSSMFFVPVGSRSGGGFSGGGFGGGGGGFGGGGFGGGGASR